MISGGRYFPPVFVILHQTLWGKIRGVLNNIFFRLDLDDWGGTRFL